MSKKISTLLLSGLLTSAVLLTACQPKPESDQQDSKKSQDANQATMDQLKTHPIKEFAATANDGHDIALLDEYDQKFSAMSAELEADLQKRAQNGTLSTEINQKLKRDSIQSALNMLKDLDLKTEQGRYIQGLRYQYWENQAKAYDEKQHATDAELNNSTDNVKGMGEMLTADEQLDHWKTKTPQ